MTMLSHVNLEAVVDTLWLNDERKSHLETTICTKKRRGDLRKHSNGFFVVVVVL